MRKVSPQGMNREPETKQPGAFGDHRDQDSNVAGLRHMDNALANVNPEHPEHKPSASSGHGRRKPAGK